MKYLIAISLFITHAATAQLSGRYVTNEELMIHGQFEIVLNNDGTYKYYDPGIGSHTSIVIEGRYTLSADTIFLAGEFDEGPPRQRRVSMVDTLIYRKRHITSLSGWKYYKQKPRRELNDLLR